MQTKPVGSTGLRISEIAFGSTSLADMPDTYGYSVPEARARDTIRAIFAGPANMIDTSRNYGLGRSEALIGSVIREMGGLPEGFVMSTKLDRDMDTLRFDAARARRSAEESLAALGLDKVGILHLHDPEYARDLGEITGKGGAIEELFRMKEEGLADAVGLAMGRIDMMEPILRSFPFDALISHNRYTLVNRSASGMFDYAVQAGIAIINAAPYASGILAKGSGATNRLVYQEVGDAALAPVRAVEAVCAEHGIPTGAAALQFSLRDPRVTATLVGVSKPERIDETLSWASATIPDEAWAALDALPHSTDDPEKEREYKPG